MMRGFKEERGLDALAAAIGMAELIDDIEKGQAPPDFFKMGAKTTDAHLVISRLKTAIRRHGSDRVLDECVSGFFREARKN